MKIKKSTCLHNVVYSECIHKSPYQVISLRSITGITKWKNKEIVKITVLKASSKERLTDFIIFPYHTGP